MNKLVFKNAHLVVSDRKEIFNATLLICDGKIEDVFYDFTKIKKDLSEYESIDLKGQIVMPAFFDTHISSLKVKPEEKGTLHYFTTFKDENALAYLDLEDEKTKALIINPNTDQKRIECAKERKLKILLGNCKEEVKKPTFEYDGFSNLFFDTLPFDVTKKGLVNLALEYRDHYIELDVCRMNKEFLNFILKSYPRDLIGFICKDYDEEHNLLKAIQMAKRINISLMDMVAYTSMNPYRFYGLNRYGEIKRGKEANLLILDKDLNLQYVMKKGMFI